MDKLTKGHLRQIFIIDKLTRDHLREMAIGETKDFKLPTAQAVDTAGTVAYQMQNVERCKFSVKKDYANTTITITKSEL